VTEQTGQNSEILPDVPAVPAEGQTAVDPPSEIAPPVVSQHDGPQHDLEERAVAEAAPVVEEGVRQAFQPDLSVPVVEEESVVEVASPEPEAAVMGQAEEIDAQSQAGKPDVQSVAEAASPEPAGRVKASGPARGRAEPAKSRKAAAPAPALAPDVPKSENMNWYILKVQSNREESIREGLLRRVSIQGLDRYFSEVIVPTEKVTEFKGGKKRVIKRKLYPGYLVVHMEINEDTWFLVRETPGIGDFTGASGVPSTMLPHEVERIIAKQEEKSEKAPDLKIPFIKGDRVKVIEGNFENFEGEVDAIDKTNGRVTVMITIFNRTTPVEFEYWQVESV
jgi:transcriptional antiterminator NusG